MTRARASSVPVRLAASLALVAIASLAPAWAGGPATDPEEASAGTWMTVSDHDLDTMRGGFDAGNGLLVSFGITRAVYINGSLVTQTTLDFGHLNNLSATQAAQLGKQLQSLNLVQNGPRNNFEAQTQGGVNVGTVIQNTLDNQHIANETVINATSNSAGMMRNINSLMSLRDNLVNSVGAR